MDAASYPSSYKISDKVVKVVYGRPQLKGRDLAKLAPNDKVWRTGANEAAADGSLDRNDHGDPLHVGLALPAVAAAALLPLPTAPLLVPALVPTVPCCGLI